MSRPISDKKAFELFGDGVPPRTTREKLLFTAIHQFYVHGFHAVGVDQIIAEVGVTKTTFYNHFSSKDDLIIEVVQTRDRWEFQTFCDNVESLGGGEPRTMLLAVFEAMDQWFRSPDFNGCTFLNACIEYPSANDPIHQAGAKHLRSIEVWLAELALQAGAEQPKALAEEFTVLTQGTLVMRHAMGRDDAAQTARRLAVSVLDRHLPAVS